MVGAPHCSPNSRTSAVTLRERNQLLYASHEPHDEREWEQWHNTIRKAIRKEAITAAMDLGTPGEQAAYHLIHAHCRRRIGSTKPAPASSP